MTLYVDTSALLKRYLHEPDSDRVNELLSSDAELVTAQHTVVELRRNLASPAHAHCGKGGPSVFRRGHRGVRCRRPGFGNL